MLLLHSSRIRFDLISLLKSLVSQSLTIFPRIFTLQLVLYGLYCLTVVHTFQCLFYLLFLNTTVVVIVLTLFSNVEPHRVRRDITLFNNVSDSLCFWRAFAGADINIIFCIFGLKMCIACSVPPSFFLRAFAERA